MVGDPSTTTTPCVRLGRRRRREEAEQLEQPRREAEDAATPGAWASDVASRWRPLRRARDQDLAPSESAVAGYEAPSRSRASGVPPARAEERYCAGRSQSNCSPHLGAVDDQLVVVRLFGREPYACSALRALDGLLVRGHVARPVGRIVRSARSRSCRAIAIGSPLNTSFAASSSVILLGLVLVAGCEVSLIRGDWTKPGRGSSGGRMPTSANARLV